MISIRKWIYIVTNVGLFFTPLILESTYASISTLVRRGKRFSLMEIKLATKNFDEIRVIRVGDFGMVYKRKLEDGVEV